MTDDRSSRPSGDGSRDRPPSPRKRPRVSPLVARPSAATAPTLVLPTPLVLVIGGILMLGLLAYSLSSKRVGVPNEVAGRPARVATGTAAATAESDAIHARVDALFGPEIWTAKDGTDFDESESWRKTVRVVSSMTPEEVRNRLEFSLNEHYEEVVADPAAFRGRFVRMRGVVAARNPVRFRAWKLAQPLDGHTDIYRGWVSGTDPDDPPVVFDVLERPADFKAVDKVADVVDVDGVFLRTVRYEIEPQVDMTLKFTKFLPDPKLPPPGPERTGVIRVIQEIEGTKYAGLDVEGVDVFDKKGDRVRFVIPVSEIHEFRDMPWVVARTVTVRNPQREAVSLTRGLLFTGGFLALVAGIVYLSRKSARPEAAGGVAAAGFKEMFQRKLREGRKEPPPPSGQK